MFPPDFRWGVATAAYQVEGAASTGGRGPSIWDTFTAEPGRVADGSTGEVACDHYFRYADDIALMAELGVTSYRFSVAWPRIQPDGTGGPHPRGVAFYDRLVDGLLEHGIEPVATLYHWDLPQALQDRGGWLSRDTAARFADYAAAVAGALGDRVAMWLTLNEPFVHMTMGHALGTHAPGQALLFDALPVAHHQLLAHGLAVPAIRAHSAGAVGIVNNYTPVRAAGDTTAGDTAAGDGTADAAAVAAYDALHNRLFTDPLLGLGYPAGIDLPAEVVRDGDLAAIAAPLDVLGVNYYNPTAVRAPSDDSPLPFEIVELSGHPVTAFGWPVVPSGLRELLTDLRDRYGPALPPIYVTENGCSYDGIDDPERVSFLDGHVRAVADAIADGVDVRGYFVWSLLDNFEWAEGYTQRFGLVHVDFATQKRTRKTSFRWYRDLIAAHRAGAADTTAADTTAADTTEARTGDSGR